VCQVLREIPLEAHQVYRDLKETLAVLANRVLMVRLDLRAKEDFLALMAKREISDLKDQLDKRAKRDCRASRE